MALSEADALKIAKELGRDQKYTEALDYCTKYLKDDPLNTHWLTLQAYIFLGFNKPEVAYPIAKLVTQLSPKFYPGWMNLGQAAKDLWRDEEAVRYFKRGMKVCDDDLSRSMFHVNIASVCVDMGDFGQAEHHCREALKLNPDSLKGKANLGFAQLAQRDWVNGWPNYRWVTGTESRPRVQFNEEPEWDGQAKGVIVLAGEQGLGDEVSFASMVPDMLTWAAQNDSKVIMECEPRLEGLFRRSFDCEVYGTRRTKTVSWDVTRVTHSIPAGQIGEYFRTRDEDFPGTPYLKPDPDRLLQWRALFESKGKPVIGVSWTGGTPKTASKYRQVALEDLLPVFESVDAHWVSLQYKPAGEEIAAFKAKHPHIDLVEYPHGTLTNDYDDTAAMIAAMDRLFIMQTAVGHLAGALGVPCWTLVPKTSQWRYGSEGEDYLWAKSVRLLRQNTRGHWADVIEKAARELRAHYTRLSGNAARAA